VSYVRLRPLAGTVGGFACDDLSDIWASVSPLLGGLPILRFKFYVAAGVRGGNCDALQLEAARRSASRSGL